MSHQKDTQELLNLLDSQEIEEEYISEEDSPVLNFIFEYKLTDGEYRVPSKLIYRLFKNYCRFKISKKTFLRDFNNHFPTFQSGKCMYYRLNIDPVKITKIFIDFRKEKERIKNEKYIRHFDAFTEAMGLGPGENWIEGYILYHIYKNVFRKTDKYRPIGYRSFIGLCKLYFHNRRITSNQCQWFKVNDKYKNYISKEEIDGIRESRRKPKRKNSKKKRRS